mmetsp:Transcript_23106/g.72710  ORF Transcript_23106/g.72710 Transcript_23106/m.72710 type:complete len:537 (-) Transcript_23106:200-1810(-)
MVAKKVAALLLGAVSLGPAAALQTRGTRELGERNCSGIQCIEDYVSLPDPSYSWTVRKDLALSGVEPESQTSWHATVINMTSQKWLTEADVDRPVWWHVLVVVEPSNLGELGDGTDDWGTLIVGRGGSAMRRVGEEIEEVQAAVYMAVRTGTRTAVLFQEPFQPEAFADDPVSHEEEEMRAIAWDRVVTNPARPEVAIEFPMTKAAVRAMDTIQTATAHAVRRFFITGFSKRGLVSWITSAVDPRVKAVMPACHALALRESMHDMRRGFYHIPVAAKPHDKYTTLRKDESQGDFLYAMFDAGASEEYISRLEKVDKLVMEVGNDDFGPVDNAKHWLHKMKGSISYIMHPNKKHMGTYERQHLLLPATAFMEGVIMKRSAPKISWEVDDLTGSITVRQESRHVPKSVTFYVAESCPAMKRRDFRFTTLDLEEVCTACGGQRSSDGYCRHSYSRWKAMELKPAAASTVSGTAWVAQVAAPAAGGFQAGFVEFTYEGPRGREPWVLTTEVSVMPKEYPFPDCTGSECEPRRGVLSLMQH